MKKIAIALCLFLTACADDAVVSECSTTTLVGGELVSCDGGAGVCLETAAGPACVERCHEESRTALCGDGEFWYTMPLSGQSICYCFDADER